MLRVEQLRFQNDTLLDLTDDTIVNVASAVNIPATGTVAITTANAQTAFRQGNILTATQNITDPNGVPARCQPGVAVAAVNRCWGDLHEHRECDDCDVHSDGCPSWADSPGRGQFHRHPRKR